MKKLVILILVIISLNRCYVVLPKTTDIYKNRYVLSQYILGVDSVKSIESKVIKQIHPNQYEYYTAYDEKNDSNFVYLTKYTLPNYHTIKILLVNDTLYGIKYSPYDVSPRLDEINDLYSINKIDKDEYDKELKKINSIYNHTNIPYESYFKYLNYNFPPERIDRQQWENENIIVFYNSQTDFFDHFDKDMLKRYPQYKKF